MKKYFTKVLYLLPLALALTPVLVLAQVVPPPYVPLEPLPGLVSGSYTFPQIMTAFFRISMIIGAALAVLLITFGGVQYMTSDVLGQKEAGRERIKNASLGFLLLLAVYVILNTVNPRLLNFNLNLTPVGIVGSTPTSPAPPQDNRITSVTPEQQQVLRDAGLPPGTFLIGGVLNNIRPGVDTPAVQDYKKQCSTLGGTPVYSQKTAVTGSWSCIK